MSGRPDSPAEGWPGEETAVAETLDHEWKASLVRETLLAEGIPAVVAGGFTGSFRAEAPGLVKVLVRACDLERARETLRRRREEAANIDWSQVDWSGERSPDDPADP
jgi:hypothetical protein